MKTIEEIQERARLEQQSAAWRTLDIFTQWMRENPQYFYITKKEVGGKFQLVVTEEYLDTGSVVVATFHGETIQDAYAQAAQAISFNGGEL